MQLESICGKHKATGAASSKLITFQSLPDPDSNKPAYSETAGITVSMLIDGIENMEVHSEGGKFTLKTVGLTDTLCIYFTNNHTGFKYTAQFNYEDFLKLLNSSCISHLTKYNKAEETEVIPF